MHLLKVKAAKSGKTAKGHSKITISLYKPSEDVDWKESKVQYWPIECHHMLSDHPKGNISQLWYQKITMWKLTKDQIDGFMSKAKGKEFKALVGHEVGEYMGFQTNKPVILGVYPTSIPDDEIIDTIDRDYWRLKWREGKF